MDRSQKGEGGKNTPLCLDMIKSYTCINQERDTGFRPPCGMCRSSRWRSVSVGSASDGADTSDLPSLYVTMSSSTTLQTISYEHLTSPQEKWNVRSHTSSSPSSSSYWKKKHTQNIELETSSQKNNLVQQHKAILYYRGRQRQKQCSMPTLLLHVVLIFASSFHYLNLCTLST